MNILEICMSKGYGGLELYVLKVAMFLNKNGNSFKVLTKSNSFLAGKLTDSHITNDNFSSVFRHLPVIAAFKLANYINKNEIDVLHVHWGNDLFFAVLGKLLSRRKVKLVYTRQMALTRDKKDIYHRFLYRNVDLYLTITKNLKIEALRYLPLEKDKIKVLYYGVPGALIGMEDCEKYIAESGMDKEKFRLAIFGRIEKGKGQHLVVSAAKNLIQKGYPVQLAMVGHIMDQAYFSQLQDEINHAGLENDILYLGFHNQPTSIMPCFDAVVLATKCETFGLVLPEAMRAEVAVVGSDCGGVPEIIQHEKTGLLFESGNVDDLSVQLEKIISDQDFCRQLARAGKADADERFSEEKHFIKLLEFFKAA